MKILVGMPSPDSWGGPISSEPPFVEALRDAGHDVTEEVYVYGDREKPTPLFKRISRVWKTAFNFRKLLKHQAFDIVHLNSAFDLRTILRDSFTLFVIDPGKAKLFFKLHGSEAPRFFHANFVTRFLIRYISSKVDGFGVHTSEEISDFKRLGFPAKKLYLVKNAIPLAAVKPGFERQFKDRNSTLRLLFVSRFVDKKGLVETIEASSILKKQGYAFKLFCVGDGELMNEARAKKSQLELDERVEFTGYISEEEVTGHFYSDDILVFPTQFGEGFPNVFFKAVAAGMPIVSTRFRAAADYLVDENNCLFCKPEPAEIAEKISVLIDDVGLRRGMSERNLVFGSTLLPENIAAEFTDVYQTLSGERL